MDDALQAKLAAAFDQQRRGLVGPAADAYAEALQRGDLEDGLRAALAFNLAVASRQLGRHDAAVEAAREATRLSSDDAEAWIQLGLCLAARGQPHEAVRAHERGLDRAPPHVAGWVNLGNARRAAADKPGAIVAYRRALALEPGHHAAHYNLHAAVFDDDDPAAAIAHLDQAAASPDATPWTHAFRWALRTRAGRAVARPEMIPAFFADSVGFCADHSGARWFADTFDTLDHAIARLPPAGDVVELGVRFGTSLRYLAQRLPDRRLHGFDSFEGHPVAWGGQAPGLYSTGGVHPRLPDNVSLHPGRFDHTVAPFAQADPAPLALVHVDCDLYGSTLSALTALAPRIDPATVLLFDDYLCNPTWREDEHRALVEVAEAQGWTPRYLAFSPFSRQAMVQVAAT